MEFSAQPADEVQHFMQATPENPANGHETAQESQSGNSCNLQDVKSGEQTEESVAELARPLIEGQEEENVDGLVTSTLQRLTKTVPKVAISKPPKPNTTPIAQVYPKLVISEALNSDLLDALPSVKTRPGVPLAPVPKDFFSYRYSMNYPKRGVAIIINNREFTMKDTPTRKGSDNDAAMLNKTLIRLGFTVYEYTDLVEKAMRDCAKYYAAQDHSDCDMFFMAIFTHGEVDNVLYAADKKIRLEDMTAPFRSDKCISLAGKPKVFVIQACRGDQLDKGVDLVDSDAGQVYRMPAEADYLFAFSTVSGYFSWRNTELGSWFIQALCRTLADSAYDPNMDLLSLLTVVNYEVAFGYESNVPSDSAWHRKKQIPCFTSMLTKRLFFTPKTGTGSAA